MAPGGESSIVRWLRDRGFPRKLLRDAHHRALLAASVAWLPLLVLSTIDGTAGGSRVDIPFLRDLVSYARFLVALPIAILAGALVGPQLDHVLTELQRGRFVPEANFPLLESAVLKAARWKGSLRVEVALLFLVYVYIAAGLPRGRPEDLSSWRTPGGPADLWCQWASMPLFLFPWMLWVWRLGVWSLLLFRISKLRLRLLGTHPDGAGGLGFIELAHRPLSILVLALSAILCASIGEEVLWRQADLRSFGQQFAAYFVVCLLVTLGPLLLFSRPLLLAKIRGWREYGTLAARYTQAFDDKWILKGGRDPGELLGTADLQSLADLQNSYSGISKTRALLPTLGTIGLFAAAFVLPLLPLLAAVMPLSQIFLGVYKLLLR